jgi:hypothetical protein
MEYWLVASLVEAFQEKEEPFVNGAHEKRSAGWNSEANHPKERGRARVREAVVKVGEAQAHPRGAVEVEVSEEMGHTTALTCRGLIVVADS